MRRQDDSPRARCWECEHPAERPTTVTLRTTQRIITTLTLCAHCYDTHYLPLAALAGTPADSPDGTLLIELDDSDA